VQTLFDAVVFSCHHSFFRRWKRILSEYVENGLIKAEEGIRGYIMTGDKQKQFEFFVAKSFENGVMLRELRLSNEEREFLLNRYPKANLKLILSPEYADGKAWYEVKLGEDCGI